MPIELTKEDRQRAVASIERYFRENMEEKIGKGVIDAQEKIQSRVEELDIEVHEAEFAYWRKFDKQAGGKR
jgi:hypothetical protein